MSSADYLSSMRMSCVNVNKYLYHYYFFKSEVSKDSLSRQNKRFEIILADTYNLLWVPVF